MAVRNATVPSLVDLLGQLDPCGGLASVAEVLERENPALQDIPWAEGNLITGDRFTVRTMLPGVGFRRLNEGVPRSKSGAAQIDEATAILEANSQVDRDLAKRAPNIAAYRLAEARPFHQSMNNKFMETLFYGNAFFEDKSFTGFAPRFNEIASPQVLDAGGTGTDNRSIWLIGWGDDVRGLYPKGTKGGLFHLDTTSNLRIGADGFPIGDTVLDPNGNPYLAYTDNWKWECGLQIKDQRKVVRIANIDSSLLTKDRTTGADLQDIIIQASGATPNLDNANFVWYMPRTVATMFSRQAYDDRRGFASMDQIIPNGPRVLTMMGIPVRSLDVLNVDEARVV